jgi:hypothetical protein
MTLSMAVRKLPSFNPSIVSTFSPLMVVMPLNSIFCQLPLFKLLADVAKLLLLISKMVVLLSVTRIPFDERSLMLHM